MPTIYATATPAGRSAVAIVRISGPSTRQVLKSMLGKVQIPKSHKARLATLYSPHTRQVLDQALVLYFQGPRSYTGEDTAELHLHGSPAVSKAVMKAIAGTHYARSAEPGEFTRRAFRNGKLDLAQVEGIRDIIAADTEIQRQAAASAASGQLSQLYENWRHQIVRCVGLLTAWVDFGEDNELGSEVLTKVQRELAQVYAEVRQHTDSICSELVRTGVRLALLGEPNAGKSSLTNLLVKRTASIVSDIPGTTRDAIEVDLDVNGHKVRLGDTAGIRNSVDKIENLGIERAHQVLDEAHLVLAISPAGSPRSSDVIDVANNLAKAGKRIIWIESKADLLGAKGWGIAVSTRSGYGIPNLLKEIARQCDTLTHHSNDAVGASERTRNLLEDQVLPGLRAGLDYVKYDVVLAGAELQAAVNGIGRITGRNISVNEVLDVVFGDFCVGK